MGAALTKEASGEKTNRSGPVPDSESVLSAEHQQGTLAGMPLFLQAPFSSPNRSGLIQRKVENEALQEQEEEKPLVQTKLIVGQSGDAYEQEADGVADAVEQRTSVQAEPPRLSGKIRDNRVQRMRSSPSTVPPSTGRTAESSLQVSDSGASLPTSVREKVEPMLGSDLSHVRVHTDSSANEAAKNLQAKAFTHKNHIWLGANQRPDDLKLMAHEATHVIQQSQSAPNGGSSPPPIQRQEEPGGNASQPANGPNAGGPPAANQSFNFSEDEMESRLASTPAQGADTSAQPAKVAPSTESKLKDVESKEGKEKPEGEAAEAEEGGKEKEGEKKEGEGKKKGATEGGGRKGKSNVEVPSETPGPATEFEGLVAEDVEAYLEGNLSDERLAQLDPVTQQLFEGASALSERQIVDPSNVNQPAPGANPARAPQPYAQDEPWVRVVSTIRDVTSTMGSVVGTIGLIATVGGMILSLLIPPVGAFFLTVGRFCDVVALVLDAISLVLSGILLGYNYYRLKNATDPEEKRRLLGLVRQEGMNTFMSLVAVATAVAPGAARRIAGNRGVQAVGRGIRTAATGAGRRIAASATSLAGSSVGRSLIGRGIIAGGRGIMTGGSAVLRSLRSAGGAISGRFHRRFGLWRQSGFIQRANQRALAFEQRLATRMGASARWQRFGATRLGGSMRRSYASNRDLATVLNEASQVRHHTYVGGRLRAELAQMQRGGATVTQAAARQRLGGPQGMFREVDPNALTFRADAAGQLALVRDPNRLNTLLNQMRQQEFQQINALANTPGMSNADIATALNNRPNAPAFWTESEVAAFRTQQGLGTVFKTPHHTISVLDAPHLQFDQRYIQLANAPLVRTPTARAPRTAADWENFATRSYPNAQFVRQTGQAEALVRSGQVRGVTDPDYFRSPQFFNEMRAQGNTGRWVNPHDTNIPPQEFLFDAHFVAGHRWQTGEAGAGRLYGTYARLGEQLQGEATARTVGTTSRFGARTVLPWWMRRREGAESTSAPAPSPTAGGPAPGGPTMNAALSPSTTTDTLTESRAFTGQASPAAQASGSPRFLAMLRAHMAQPLLTSMRSQPAATPSAGAAKSVTGDSSAVSATGEKIPEPPPSPVLYSPQSLAQIRESRIAVADTIKSIGTYIEAANEAESHNQEAAQAADGVKERGANEQATAETERADVAGQQEKLTQSEGAQQNMAQESERASGQSDNAKSEGEGVQNEGSNVSVEAKPEEPRSKSWLERAWDATAGALWDRLIAPAIRLVKRKLNQVMQKINEFIMGIINQALGLDEIEAEIGNGGQDIQGRRSSLQESDAGLEETGTQAADAQTGAEQAKAQAETNIEEARAIRGDAESLLAAFVAHDQTLKQEEEIGKAYIADLGSRYQPYFEWQKGISKSETAPPTESREEPREQQEETTGMVQVAPCLAYISELEQGERRGAEEIAGLAGASSDAANPDQQGEARATSGAALAGFQSGQGQRLSRLAALRSEAEGCIGLPQATGVEKLEQIMSELAELGDSLEQDRQVALEALSESHLSAASSDAGEELQS